MIVLPLARRFVSFLLAGGVNTLFGYGMFSGLVLLGVSPHVALVFGAVTGVLFNFLTTSAVFRSRDLGLLPRFLAVYAAMLGLNMLLLEAAMRAGFGPLLAQAIVLPIFTLTFLAMRRFVFAAPPEQTS